MTYFCLKRSPDSGYTPGEGNGEQLSRYVKLRPLECVSCLTLQRSDKRLSARAAKAKSRDKVTVIFGLNTAREQRGYYNSSR
jgi:hypothetical protein